MPLRTDGDALRERRENKGLTIVAFAELAGYHPNHVSQVELGNVNAGPGYHRKAAEILGCQIDDITNGSIPRRTSARRQAATA